MSLRSQHCAEFFAELSYKRRVHLFRSLFIWRPADVLFWIRSKFMKSSFRKMFLIPFFAAIFAVGVFAQEDPNPDSPTPGLLSSPDRTRILAVNTRGWDGSVPASGGLVFRPSRTNSITIFVSNLQLMSGEGANSIRVYLTQRSGKTFELQTDQIIPIAKGVHALQFRLFDPIGYRGRRSPMGTRRSISHGVVS